MFAQKDAWQPWWKTPTSYQEFEMLDEFQRGLAAQGYRPSSRSDAMYALYTAGFVRKSFSIPKSAGKPDVR